MEDTHTGAASTGGHGGHAPPPPPPAHFLQVFKEIRKKTKIKESIKKK